MISWGPLRANLRGGVYAGMAAWLAYLAVEQAFLGVAPTSSGNRERMSWEALPALAAAYAAIGMALGSVGAVLTHAIRRLSERAAQMPAASLHRMMAAVGLLAALAVDQYARAQGPIFRWLPALLLLAISPAFAGVLWELPWSGRFGFVRSAWFVSFAVAGANWMLVDRLGNRSLAWKAGGLLLLFAGLFPAAAFAGWIWRRSMVGRTETEVSRFEMAGAMAAVVLAWAATLALQPQPVREAANRIAVSPGGNRANVVLIVLDTVRADHLSVYGYARETTPALRQLVQQATLYRNATAAADMTLPSHGSIFTGLYPSWHGAHYTPGEPFGAPLPDDCVTLAEILQGRGYRTLAVIANGGYVNRHFGFAQGFEYFDARPGMQFLGDAPPYYLRDRVRRGIAALAGRDPDGGPYRRAGEITGEAIHLLERRPGNRQPFFLFLNYMDAHQPLAPPPPYDTMFPGKNWNSTFRDWLRARGEIGSLKRKATLRERGHWLSQYDGAIAYMDSQIRRLLNRLRDLGEYDRTLIIITSDHGESFGGRSYLGHSVSSAYQNLVHVPLLIKFPGGGFSSVVEGRVSHVDILPTVLEALKLPVPNGLHGESLLRRREDRPRWILSEAFPTPFLSGARYAQTERALFRGPLKLLVSTAGKRELYDLSSDPAEKQNLFKTDDPASQQMLGLLNSWLQTVSSKVPSRPADTRTLQRLKSLGYVQ